MDAGENTGMSLEDLLLSTGEMEYMGKLIRHCARDKAGLSPEKMLDVVVHPLLDELELYIKREVSSPQDAVQLKAVVHQWISSRFDGPNI
ncbi:hypothetical protein [Methanogenium sp. MK-MG]|uniref:hypothetical protein n=1 Tax=Methanogenium sp. MK-MG TaxID=2599926 RepID=UPI0013EE3430|nr:hypothetical protein [Methanogenium sp. MK-MG]